jgi:hypothetical protein
MPDCKGVCTLVLFASIFSREKVVLSCWWLQFFHARLRLLISGIMLLRVACRTARNAGSKDDSIYSCVY